MYNLEDFKNKTWYHQRFDGCPLFLSFIGEADTMHDLLRANGTEAKHRLCFYKDEKADWFFDYQDINDETDLILKNISQNENWCEETMAKYITREIEFNEFYKKFNESNLQKLDDLELAEIFTKYHTLAVARFGSSATIDHFALGTDKMIADLIRKETGPFSSEREFTNFFSTLTAPIHQSFISEAEISLLEIAKTAKQNGLENLEIQSALYAHAEKYFWIRNNYYNGEKTTPNEFLNEIKVILASTIDITEAQEKITNTPIRNLLQKSELISKLSPSSHLLQLLKISERFTFWQDERKKDSFLSAYMGTYLIKEMAHRKFISINQLKYLGAREIEEWFTGKSELPKNLEERKKFCAVIYSAGTHEFITGKLATDLQNIVDPKDLSETPNDIRGLVANPGLVRGPARIILSANDINLVQPGDILIAVMTRPDYVPGMKKAAAVVTDEGGITSHAAIVSRELSVPCIIGTKIATRVFKNGDLLEVNANHGVVKKLS